MRVEETDDREKERRAWRRVEKKRRGAWMAQSIKRPTLDFGSGHNLMVCEMERRVGFYTDSTARSLLGISLSLSLPFTLCLSPTHTRSLSLNKSEKKKRRNIETEKAEHYSARDERDKKMNSKIIIEANLTGCHGL